MIEHPALTIERVGYDPETISSWDRFVLACPAATGYHLMAWRQIIERAFGHNTVYLMARDASGEIRGVLPLVSFRSLLFGKFVVSMPFLNYGGIAALDDQARDALLAAAEVLGTSHDVKHIELRQSGVLPILWKRKDHRVSMRLELPKDFQSLMASFPSKLRSQIRRPQKEGMTARIGGIELLDDFYQVFARNMRDVGTPVYAKRWFQEIVQTLPKEVALCSVVYNRKPVAAGLLYTFRDTMEIPWASSDHRFDRMAPNMLLYSAALEHACQQGCRVFDFGRSPLESGTYRFKAQWGAKPVPLHWYYWLKQDGPLPELNPANPRYQVAIGIWRKLPLQVTKWFGPHIVKHLP